MHWQLNFSLPAALRFVVLTALFSAISACTVELNESSPATNGANNPPDTIVNDITLPMPAGFSGLRAVIMSNVYAIVSIDGYNPKRFEPGDRLIASYQITRGDTFTGTIEWFETLPGSVELRLASYRIEETVEESFSLFIDSLSYETEGTGFDDDNDSFSNLRERRADSDPLNRNETPDTTPDVRIGSINPLTPAPVIDGLYDSVYGDSAVFNDEDGEQLSIDNLMIDQGAIRPDGSTEFRWFAVHDNTFLYIFVLGEGVELGTPIRDSTAFFQDDSIDIFIDADNSKGSAYDGINDRHIIIPLLTSPAVTTGSNTTAITAGPNSASLPPIDFATCRCTTDQNTWEVRIPLEAFGIEKDTPFGFEIQLNDDNDGGARDAKWGWYHPSRTTVDVDNTFSIPSFMGTAVIN